MSGDATKILHRRADAPTRQASDGLALLDDAEKLEAPDGGWTDFGGTNLFDERILKDTASDDYGDEFWGPERPEVLDGDAKRLIRQAAVVVVMVMVMGAVAWLADTSSDGAEIAAVAPGSNAEGQRAASVTPPSEPRAGLGMQSSSVEPDAAPDFDRARALANAESAIAALSQTFDGESTSDAAAPHASSSSTEQPTTAPPTTAAPTTAQPTTAPPTTAAPTTTAPTTAPSAGETPSSEAAASVSPADSSAADGSTDAATTGEEAIDETASDDQAVDGQSEPEAPTTTAHPDGWVDAGHGVFVPPVLLEIRWCESRHNYTAANPASSARGAYQFLRGSWADYGHRDRYGVTEAHLATPAQQDEAALITWQRSGTRPWNASKHCWG